MSGTDDGNGYEVDGYEVVDDPDGYFGEAVAARYDDTSSEMFDVEVVDPVVELIAGLAGRPGRPGGPGGGARALEFGVGTGRIALPLARRGVAVHGIDLSRAMVERLRAKPGGEDIGVTLGDFATARVDGPGFAVAYLVFNTINNLTTQDAQVDCFRNAAAHLVPGGCFVIEVGVPDLRRLPPGQNAVPFHVGPRRLGFDDGSGSGSGSGGMGGPGGTPTQQHIHTIIRTPNGGDYGIDLLKLHLENDH